MIHNLEESYKNYAYVDEEEHNLIFNEEVENALVLIKNYYSEILNEYNIDINSYQVMFAFCLLSKKLDYKNKLLTSSLN
jgi:hypothetical protein